MNLTDRIYLAVHIGLTLLVCARHQYFPRWPYLVTWNLAAMAAIFLLARRQQKSTAWEFAHDFLPGFVFFTTVFEEVAFLCLTVRGQWQNQHLVALESTLFALQPLVWLHRSVPGWAVELLQFGYFAFYPIYPVVGLIFWSWRKKPDLHSAFRDMTDALSVGYLICYVVFIAWPTQSPRHAGNIVPAGQTGPFAWLIGLIQSTGGVQGNAFPSAHIMLAFVVLAFAARYWPKAAPWLMAINLLMCLGAVYDGYHYTVDVIAGALLGMIVAAAFLRHGASEQAA
jgi:membrane-associated phospholipid phosphatase